MKIGTVTTFYQFKGDIFDRVERLAKIFHKINKEPYIQLNAGIQSVSFDVVVKKLNKLKDEYNITYSVHQSMFIPNNDFFLNLSSSNKKVWEQTLGACKQSIELAKQVGAKYYSLHGGNACENITRETEYSTMGANNHISYEDAYANFKEGLIILLGYSNGEVEISVENKVHRPNLRHLFTKPEDFYNLPTGIGMLLDIGHGYYSQIVLGDSLYFDRLIKKVKITEIHLSDNEGDRDCHWFINDGLVPVREILKKIELQQGIPNLVIEASSTRWGYIDMELSNNILEVYNIVKEIEIWKERRRVLYENYSRILSEP